MHFRDGYRNVLAWAVASAAGYRRFSSCVLLAFSLSAVSAVWAWISSRRWMPGRCGCMSRCPPGTRLEETQADFAKVESAIRQIVGNNQVDVVLDNIGLPYSGINIALSDTRHGRPDGWRNSDLPEGKPHAHRRPHGRSAPRIAQAVSRHAVLSFSRPISSTRC